MRAVAPVIALVVAGSVLVACGGPQQGEQRDGLLRVDVGVLPITDVAPLFLGIEKGFFAEEGLEVEPHFAQAGPVIVPSVVSGEFEFGFSNTTSLLIAVSKGLPLRIVARGALGGSSESESTADVLVLADSPIREPADLEGKTISVPALATISSLSTNAALEKHGVDVSTIEYTEIPFPEAIPALEEGTVDAIFVTEPFITLGRKAGHRSVMDPILETAPDFIVSGYFTTERYIAEHKNVVDRFVRAINRSLDYAVSNPDELRAVVPTYTEIPPDIAEQMTLPDFSRYSDTSTLELNAELAKRYGYLEEIPAVADVLYDR